jgi:hypothetical protein
VQEISRRDTESFLRELGAEDEVIVGVCERVNDNDVQSMIRRFRTYAEENPAVILGALSAVILGGGAVAARKVMKNSRKTAKKSTRKRSTKASKRTLIEPHPGDKRYVRRDARGRIKESVDVGRSLSADRKRSSKTRAKAGQGDKGDR